MLTTPADALSSDALTLLQADHERVKALLITFAHLQSQADADQLLAELIDDICYELTVHAMLEEELFYPALRSASCDDTVLDDAELEHAGIRELVSQLEVMYPGDDHFSATVAVLAEEVRHHLALEEGDLFDAARSTGIDLEALGKRLLARRKELEGDLSAPPAPPEPHAGMRRAPRTAD